MSRRWLFLIVATLAAIAAGLGFYWPFGGGPRSMRLFGVVEIQEVRLGSKIGGRVEEVLIKEGDLIRAPYYQPLVRFEAPELQAQKAQLEARLQAAEAELQKAEAGPREQEIRAAKAAADAAQARLDKIKKGWREEEIKQAASDLDSAEADLKQALEDLERTRRLYRQQSASRADYDAALANRDRAQGRVNAALARHEMMKRGNRPEEIAEAAAEWERARAHWDLLRAGTRPEDIAVARAHVTEIGGKLAEVEAQLREAVIRAPRYPAIVEVLSVRPGDLVPPNQPVIRLLRAEDLWVKVYVPETELGKVRLGQRVEVKIDSYPDKRFQGEVFQIATISEFTPRNVQSVDERRHQVFGVKIRVDDPQGVFRAGMAAEVVLPVPEE